MAKILEVNNCGDCGRSKNIPGIGLRCLPLCRQVPARGIQDDCPLGDKSEATKQPPVAPAALIARARETYADGSDDNIEVDDNALESRPDLDEGGTWVQGWLWVEFETVKCKFCQGFEIDCLAHRHDGGWVCENCWDERLRVAE